MLYCFDPTPTPVVPVEGNDALFPVHRIYCVGRNYAEHALEMGGNPDREPPFFFSKPADTIVPSGSQLAYPQATENFHFEMELVIAIGKDGKDLKAEEAEDVIFGYAAGIDLTRRDLQAAAKKAGRPWDTAKGFDYSAPCAAITPKEQTSDIEQSRISLSVNGEVKQDAKISDMIWNPFEIVAHLSHFYTIKAGDLIYTGTPAGVGALNPGDTVEGKIEGLSPITLMIV
ncbi:fumarylacetoacetate hydrolase family protein [Sneathiella limimaris]|uniref:fumarylacetoacetate hydrolase family protein n=1 Tax=Sneathiella limimaris TaxID=1964213 RepID=UPI00146D6E5F|nr:fumarylacetoacetate hydrolase family protein [Sneathiella limimaris]